MMFVLEEGRLLVRGSEAQVNYSTSQKIHRAGAVDEAPRLHRVLLLSILNDRYPIDVVSLKVLSPLLPSLAQPSGFMPEQGRQASTAASVRCQLAMLDL